MIQQTYVAKRLKTQQSYQCSLHFHDVFELFFSLNDGCRFFLGDRSYDISRGVIILIPEGIVHRKVNPPGVFVETYTAHFPIAFLESYSTPQTDLVRAFNENIACVQLPDSEIERIKLMFDRCVPDADETFGSDIKKNLYLLDLLLTIYPFISEFPLTDNSTQRTTPLVSEVIHYINLHLTEPITLDMLAKQFFVSKFNLCRQFKKETGFTIIQYINSSRIRLACSLIREESRIANVGSRAGFSNASHFTNTFRQYTGVTPRDYLKQYEKSTNAPIFGNYSSTKANSGE